MIVSRNLLNKVCPSLKKVSQSKLLEAFNSVGIEVENILVHKQPSHCFVGEILKVTKHPNADHLNVCQVKVSTKKIQTIVCGASNVRVGLKVVVADKGCKLANGKKIEYQKIRGIDSQGMLCAYHELTNLSNYLAKEDLEGIIELDASVQIGKTNISFLIGLDDVIFDLSLPANRNDLNGVLFLVKELCAFLKINFDLNIKTKLKFDDHINLKVDKNVASMVASATLKNISIKPSSWIQKALLMNNGIRPVNQTIDQLSYITLLTNIPMAVYDANKVGDTLTISKLAKAREFLGLDQKKYQLLKDDLLVTSNQNDLSLGGIIGSETAKITNKSTKGVIEIANFLYWQVRNTSMRLNLQTDAAKRFSKINSDWSLFKTLELLQQSFKTKISNFASNLTTFHEQKMSFNLECLNAFLGVKLPFNETKNILQSYGYHFISHKLVKLPPWRNDLANEFDIYEDVLKSLNINCLENEPICCEALFNEDNNEFKKTKKIKEILINNYFNEVKNYNLVHKTSLLDIKNAIKIQNPVSLDHEFFRDHLMSSLLKVYQLNQSYKNQLEPIFEIQNLPNKQNVLAFLTPEKYVLDLPNKNFIKFNNASLKGILNELGNALGVRFEYGKSQAHYYYDNECLAISYQGKILGYLGAIKKTFNNNYQLDQKQKFYGLEIDFSSLLNHEKPLICQIKKHSDLIYVTREITIIAKNQLAKLDSLILDLVKLEKFDRVILVDHFQKDDNESFTIKLVFLNNKVYQTNEIETILKQVQTVIHKNNFEIK